MAAGTARATILNELQSLKEEGYIEIRKEHSASFCRFVAQTIYLISMHPKSIRGFYQAILNAFRYEDFEECRINHDSLRQVGVVRPVRQGSVACSAGESPVAEGAPTPLCSESCVM